MASINFKINTLEDNYNTISNKLKDLEAQIRTLLVEQNNIKCDTNADEGKYPYDCKTIFTHFNNNFNKFKVIVAFIFYFDRYNNIG